MFFRIGYYCDGQGMASPRGPCDPGYICLSGAYTSTPTDGITGQICPAGGFCPEGSFVSLPCPAGTFSNTSGEISLSENFTCIPKP